ncbi:EfeM/EfeO family lipoprotein [Subtercola boreus]|uniref:EfeM/EfeO family lipoprotein n=1 Tax=Subtercola boreus TaxID=120213 RepID=UPI0014764C53|nr:EfeM/EfeO family lipoprotein [Subtercola boreus]
MPHSPSRQTAGLAVFAAGAALLLALTGCTASSPGEAAAAAAAKPLSQQAFITRQLSLSSVDFGEYLRRQAFTLEAGTAEFVAAYESGDDELARSLYAPTRVFYNRMLGGAAAFPELDASLDSQLATCDCPGVYPGWHAVEADLFGGSDPAPEGAAAAATSDTRKTRGDQLLTDTKALSSAVAGLRPSVEEQAAGVAALMNGRATAAAAGLAEPHSHSDLSDLQAYIDGAREVFSGLRPILVTQNAALATTLDHRFEAAEGELNGLRTGISFPGYDTLSEEQRQTLQSAVADLTSSLGQVPGTLAS